MFGSILLMLFAWSTYVGCKASDSITVSLLEEVLSLKDTIAELQTRQEILELQLETATCSCESSESISGIRMHFIF